MKVYTKIYMCVIYGYDANTFKSDDIIISSNNDDIPYIIVVNKSGVFCYGAKYEVYHDNNKVNCDDVKSLLELNTTEYNVFKYIIMNLHNFNNVLYTLNEFAYAICNMSNSTINDKKVNINNIIEFNNDYVIDINELLVEFNSSITANKYFSNFDFISLFEKLNDKVIALLVVDENNELNQYRCCIDTMLNVSIQYVDKSTDDVIDLIDFKINEYDITNNLNVILFVMFIHLYIYMYVEHFTL